MTFRNSSSKSSLGYFSFPNPRRNPPIVSPAWPLATSTGTPEQPSRFGGRRNKHTASTPNLRTLYLTSARSEPQTQDAAYHPQTPLPSTPGLKTPLTGIWRLPSLYLKRNSEEKNRERTSPAPPVKLVKTPRRPSVRHKPISRPFPQADLSLYPIIPPYHTHDSSHHGQTDDQPEAPIQPNTRSPRPHHPISIPQGLKPIRHRRPLPAYVPVNSNGSEMVHDFIIGESILENPDYFVMNPSWDPTIDTRNDLFLYSTGDGRITERVLSPEKKASVECTPALPELKRKWREICVPDLPSSGWDPDCWTVAPDIRSAPV